MKIKQVFVAILCLFSGTMMAQDVQVMPATPKDAAVKVGHLDNGLTYYIRHNEYPKGKVNFYIAQKVGAIEEEDNQNGLAHLLEHMAFNGSKHFPDDSVNNFIFSLGATFNAYTKSDNTVYYIDGVSNERQSAIDSCLLVLSDWSSGLTLTEEQIQTERDVVHNEFRSHSALQRIIFNSVQDLFPDSKYGKRTIIGDMNVIDNCSPETLRAYYHKWYYPGNQAIIVVGDIDPDKIEASIKRIFAPLPVPEGATKAITIAVPDNEKTLYSYGSNKEVNPTVFLLTRKLLDSSLDMRSYLPYYMEKEIQELVSTMFNNRMMKLTQKPESSLMQVVTMASTYGNTQQNYSRPGQLIQAVPKVGKEKEAFQELFREMNRIGQYGFTESELKLGKEAAKTALDDAYNNRTTITNDAHAQKLVNNFLTNEPYPSEEQTHDMLLQVLQFLPLQAVNELAKTLINADEKNLGVIVAAQERDGKAVITKEDLAQLASNGRAEKVEQIPDNVKEEPMMLTEPEPGKIVSEKENKALGAKELTLSNGIKVMLKKTDFKADEIVASVVAKGGKSVLSNETSGMQKAFSEVLSAHKLGTKGFVDIINIAQTKNTIIMPSVTNDVHSLVGQTNNANLETLMQEINLSFTGVSKDEAYFQQVLQALSASIAGKKEDPKKNVLDTLRLYMHNKDARFLSLNEEEIAQINADRVLEIYNNLYGNPGEFQFSFVGSFDESAIRPLIEKYIASLPVNKKNTEVKDSRNYTQGKVLKEFTMKMENPQSVTRDFYRSAPVAYTLQNKVNATALSFVLWNKMFEIIRERESAAYTPQPGATLENDLNGSYFEIISEVGTNPNKTKIANKLISEIIEAVPTATTEADVQKAREIILKQYMDQVKTNEFWQDVLTDYQIYGIDKITGWEEAVKAVSPASVGAVAREILKSGNHVRVVMNAEKK